MSPASVSASSGISVAVPLFELGDAVMASLEIVDRVHPEGLPSAHIGVNAGPMIYDEGDYFGRTVNIAARIAAQAGPDQVFVGEDVSTSHHAERIPPHRGRSL